ncbi:MAG: nicotinate (nicotinamide) nucleotide adenylyltransferase [Proteobacteria bacterium]|nr:nicotinate (nicotinamide) nucleotide adenylyltransferase [Pseudomonadota bacterium]
MKIAIFGGSFNPVHRGHVEIVQLALSCGRVDRVVIVPAYKNPLKEELPSLPEVLRCEMLKVVFDGMENVDISTHELRNKEPSYSYKTVKYFKKLYPSVKLYFILGQDACNQFHLWKNYEEILVLSRLLVYRRAGYPMIANPSLQKGRVEWMDGVIPDISSTRIRSSNQNIIRELEWLHPNTGYLWKAYRNKNSNGNEEIVK